MSKITILIVGETKSGKSAIAGEVASALRQLGFAVNHIGEDGPTPRTPEVSRAAALRSLWESGLKVAVREISV